MFLNLINLTNGSLHQVFARNPIVPINFADPRRLEETLVNIHKQSKAAISRTKPGKDSELQLLIVILPDVTGSYGQRKCIEAMLL